MAGKFGSKHGQTRTGTHAVELALDLTDEAVTLYERAASGGWKKFASAELEDPEFSIVIGLLRNEAESRVGGSRPVRLWLPPEQVLHRRVKIEAEDEASRMDAAFRYVETETAFKPEDVAIAVAPRSRHGETSILITFAQTWREARDYARRWGFQPGAVSTRNRAGDFGAAGPEFRLRHQPMAIPVLPRKRRHYAALAGGIAAAAAAVLIWVLLPPGPPPETVTPPAPDSGVTASAPAMAPGTAAPPAAEQAGRATPPADSAPAAVPVQVPAGPLPEPHPSMITRMRVVPSEAEFARARDKAPGQTAPASPAGLAPVRVAPWGSQPEARPPAAPSPAAAEPHQPDPAEGGAPVPVTAPPQQPARLAVQPPSEIAPDIRRPEAPARHALPSSLGPAPETPPVPAAKAPPEPGPAEGEDADAAPPVPLPIPRPGAAEGTELAGGLVLPPPRPAPEAGPDEPAPAEPEAVASLTEPPPEASAEDAVTTAETGATPPDEATAAAEATGTLPPTDATPESTAPAATAPPPIEMAMAAPMPAPPEAADENAPTVLAVMTSPRPPTRPAQPAIPTRLPKVNLLPNIGTATPGSVRSAATEQGLPLDKTALIGILNLDGNRKALLRLPDGRYKSVVIGDVLDGWRVSAIGNDAMRVSKDGTDRTLPLVNR